MSWRHWICDARTGQIIAPIDIPSFSWQMGISDFGFATTDKGPGKTDESSLTIPWTAIPASTAAERNALLDSQRRAIVTEWVTDMDNNSGYGTATPIFWGKIGAREDGFLDTTFSLESPMTILADRYAVRDGAFQDGHSDDVISFESMSYRGICSELGRIATSAKQGGALPFDWSYLGEAGAHQRTNYQAWNVQNLAVSNLLSNITNCQGGPDITFRPYRTQDGRHFRVRFLAGSDADVFLDADRLPISFTYSPQGGDVEDIHVAYQDGYHRWYATGAGTDESTVTACVEHMDLINSANDPPVLRETVYGDTDTEGLDLLRSHVQGVATQSGTKLMQITGVVDFNDADNNGHPKHPAGSYWPGESVDLYLNGFPSLPDGMYHLRLMEMSGDQSDKATLKFDVAPAPFQ
ncbi:hypothetical protein [Bifidobacterium bombi]|uniref:Uncharacterized protein n=1 Tax=Bifidobacterium bombi DSM 19703 TaxID=1341695 RepID=A0A080N3D3_9BIFI|nr:hypothetical protein [Bifidobacterium bombi]KFF31642.1 hypothetical protein BBOMB_1028 [Bifidobacterium bombi DSM 19703]